MSQKILEKYRSLPKKMYKHKKTVPTFSEFIEYVLDLYEKNGEIDMHWAPVVNFCSICKVSKLFNTYYGSGDSFTTVIHILRSLL